MQLNEKTGIQEVTNQAVTIIKKHQSFMGIPSPSAVKSFGLPCGTSLAVYVWPCCNKFFWYHWIERVEIHSSAVIVLVGWERANLTLMSFLLLAGTAGGIAGNNSMLWLLEISLIWGQYTKNRFFAR